MMCLVYLKDLQHCRCIGYHSVIGIYNILYIYIYMKTTPFANDYDCIGVLHSYAGML